MNEYLHIFDFDYTLYRTTENIYVWSPRGDFIKDDKKSIRLNSQDFFFYKIAEDEYIDESSFCDFSSIDFEKAKPIEPVLNIFNNAKKKIILTARSNLCESCIRKSLYGDYDFFGLGDGDPEKKINFIKSINEDKLIVYEDSPMVIDLCKKNSINNVFIKSRLKKLNLEYTFY